jgi:hypothetical protein
MSDVVLVLGPVAFSDFEVPERIAFGGAQRLAVHKLPGGQRVIDALGRDDRELAWSGVFAGPDATERARTLDLLRVQGAVLPLTWDVFYYSVVIASFEVEYRKEWWIPYRLTCTVLLDQAEPMPDPAASLSAQATTDVGSAAGMAGNAGISLAAAEDAIAAPGALTPGTSTFAMAASLVGQAQSQIGAGIAQAESQLDAVTGATPLLGPGAAAAAVAGFEVISSAAGQLAALAAANGYVGRTLLNLTGTQRG